MPIPATTVPGTYYALFVADYLHQVAETNENNNLLAIPVQVLKPNPDLVLTTSFAVQPARVAAGLPADVAYQLANQGTTLAASPAVGFYLSTDKVLSADDLLIGSDKFWSSSDVSPAVPFYPRTGVITVPRSTSPGQYYVLGVADYLHELAESDETNNVRFAALEVTPTQSDLTIVASPYVSPKQAVAGSQVTTESYLYNIGASLATATKVGYYLSADPVLSPDDVLLGSTTTGEIEAGYSAIVVDKFTLPATTAGGRYYVLFVADYLNQLAESSETNNTSYTNMLVTVPGVDLRVQAPTAVAVDGLVAATCTIFNGGTALAASSAAGFYLSTDASFDATDVLLGASPGGAMASGVLSPRRATLPIPATTAAGTYYLLLVADPLNTVPEADENNNVAFVAFRVTQAFGGTVVPASGGTTLTACTGKVYDSGGPAGTYPHSADGTLTIVPGTAGSFIYLALSTFITENGPDYLQVYDGLSTAAPLLGTYSGSYSGTSGGGLVPGTIQASGSNASGALTLRFVSDGSTSAAGFEASIGCSQRLAAREQTAGYTLSVAPNPVAGPTPLRVQLSGLGTRAEATLTLLNSLGQQVATQAITLLPGRINQAEIDTRGLAAGVYLLRLTGSDLHATRRLVVE